MATARLLVLSPDDEVLLVRGRLPEVSTAALLDPPGWLAGSLAVVRTVARVGDDRLVLAECLRPCNDGSATWIRPRGAALSAEIAEALESLAATAVNERPEWMQRGWMAGVLRWAAEVADEAGRGPITGFRQLKHWGLSAVVRVHARGGDLVVKEVPPGLDYEGSVTAVLGSIAEGVVPRVLALQGRRFAMVAVDAEDRSVEPSGLQTLAALQRNAADRTADLTAAGCPERRPETLASDVDALLMREDLVYARGWTLASTDGRRPTRPLEPHDAQHLRSRLDRIDADAQHLAGTAPTTTAHGDFHPLNVLSVDNQVVILDWTTISLGDPRADLPTWQQLATTNAGVGEFLEAWPTAPRQWDELAYCAYIANALTCAKLADSMIETSARLDWAAAVQKRLLEALELMQ